MSNEFGYGNNITRIEISLRPFYSCGFCNYMDEDIERMVDHLLEKHQPNMGTSIKAVVNKKFPDWKWSNE